MTQFIQQIKPFISKNILLKNISTVVIPFCGAIHARIKQYPGVTTDGCGIGRESWVTSGKCFEWGGNEWANIHMGREVKQGEGPWIAYIRGRQFTYWGTIDEYIIILLLLLLPGQSTSLSPCNL